MIKTLLFIMLLSTLFVNLQAYNQKDLEKLLSYQYCPGGDLSKASLSKANLAGADLSEVNLAGAELSEANLQNSFLTGANLQNANLSKANLSGSQLSNAKLIGANLSGSDLSNADFSESDLTNANLKGAKDSEVKFTDTLFSNTIMPDGSKFSGYMGRTQLRQNDMDLNQTTGIGSE